MAVRKLLAGAGVGAVLAFGVLVSPAQAAPAQAPAPVPDVGILSCPGGEPPASPGYRCLSPYTTLAQCQAGVERNIAVTPATSGYCQSYNGRWWGFVNIY
ncbi:hypothetical protein ACFXG1_23065 [Streptomyces sp. NPDC059248]|uniref:hypothetical protein n=1 Tax=Streptomyces sp. NPDC059248 TaxID=3346791 RepID=UPI0036C17D9C